MFRRALIGTRSILKPRLCTGTGPLQRCQHDDRSVVKVLNMEMDSGLMVDAYSQLGFRLNNGMSVIGPIAIFPKTVLSWCVSSASDVNEDSLSLFYLLEPKIDILIIGVGDRGTAVDTSIIQFMKHKGISVEMLPTESACTTFNFLNQERRCVAGALIPPNALRITEDELVRAQQQRKRLHSATGEEEDAVI